MRRPKPAKSKEAKPPVPQGGTFHFLIALIAPA